MFAKPTDKMLRHRYVEC